MKAMLLRKIVSLSEVETPLELVDLPMPQPAPHQVRLRVSACGVCHTELDEIEGRTPPPRLPVVPGHEVVGRVDQVGSAVTRLKTNDRVGVAWIYSSSGRADENLSPDFVATGRDVNGGYAQYMTVPEDYAHPIPGIFSDEQAAPLLCAGAVGFRALKLSGLKDGDSLGLTGFGGSGHLVLQMTRARFPSSKVYVFARDPKARAFALELGAHWAGDTTHRPPRPLQAIIDTTPVWTPIVNALDSLAPGGRLVINAIRKEDVDKTSLLDLSYSRHLWMEKEIKSVANVTRTDVVEFLDLAAAASLRPEVHTYPLEDANRALLELKKGSVRGVKVLLIS